MTKRQRCRETKKRCKVTRSPGVTDGDLVPRPLQEAAEVPLGRVVHLVLQVNRVHKDIRDKEENLESRVNWVHQEFVVHLVQQVFQEKTGMMVEMVMLVLSDQLEHQDILDLLVHLDFLDRRDIGDFLVQLV